MKNNSGAALITAIIVVTVIGFLGVIVAALFVSKTASTTDRLSSVRAQFIAEGGLEKGIKGYRADCDNHAGEANVALGGGQFTINLSTTAFDGTTLPDVQKRISSTGNIAGAVKKVEQIVACSAPLTVPLAIATVTTSVGGIVNCGGGTCTFSWWPYGYVGDCDCIEQNITATFPAVSVPAGLSAPPGGICEYNKKTSTWPAGTYYCNKFHMNSGSVINVSGPVTIYTNDFEMNAKSKLNMNAGSSASNLLVMVTAGGYAQINSQSRFQGFIYAPSVNVGIYGKSVTYGGVTANNVTLDSSSNAIWDYTAGTSIPNYDILTGIETRVNWREAPP